MDDNNVGKLFVDISLPPFRRKLRKVALKQGTISEQLPY
jgi:hypothetical protein